MDEAGAERWICDRLRDAADARTDAAAALHGPRALDAVVAAARRHRIHLVLAAACGAARSDRAIREALADDVRRAVLQDALREAECRRLAAACAGAGIPLLIFKGAALAWSVYEPAWTRPFVDVDVLVPEEGVARLRTMLEAIGYRQAAQVDGPLVTRQAAFVRRGAAGYRHQVDVHWRLFNPEMVGAVFTCEELLARAEPVPVLGPAARRPCDADALVIAAVHRAAHHNDADELIWIRDADRLARRLPADAWRAVASTARDRRVGVLCAAALSRAVACFGTPVPPDVLRVLEADRSERSAMFLGGTLGELDIQLTNFAHLRWRDRPAFVAQHLFPAPAYMRRAYGATTVPGVAWSYAARLAAGLPRWLRQRAALRAQRPTNPAPAAAATRADSSAAAPPPPSA